MLHAPEWHARSASQVIFGHVTFLVVLLFWQSIKAWICRSPLVFLDVLCISQKNENLKRAGILGHSNETFKLQFLQVLVLWLLSRGEHLECQSVSQGVSPNSPAIYSNRLWRCCVLFTSLVIGALIAGRDV